MAKVSRIRPMTVEDLYGPDVPEKFTELIAGELVLSVRAGYRHVRTAKNLARIFEKFCAERSNLEYFGDSIGFLIQRDPDTVLSPQAALLRSRESGEDPWVPFAPDLAVEILTLSNSHAEMAYKRHQYFEAGAEQFWLVDPQEMNIQFFFRDGRCIAASDGETIEGEGIAARMKIGLTEVFRGK